MTEANANYADQLLHYVRIGHQVNQAKVEIAF